MAVGDNVCTPLFEPSDRVTVHCTGNVVGKTFGAVSGHDNDYRGILS